MIEINKEQFQEKIKESRPNAFFFTRPSCCVCDMLFDELKKRNTSKYHKININEDLIYYKSELGIWAIPSTRIYYNSTVLWECSGVLYDAQFREFISVFRNGKID